MDEEKYTRDSAKKSARNKGRDEKSRTAEKKHGSKLKNEAWILRKSLYQMQRTKTLMKIQEKMFRTRWMKSSIKGMRQSEGCLFLMGGIYGRQGI